MFRRSFLVFLAIFVLGASSFAFVRVGATAASMSLTCTSTSNTTSNATTTTTSGTASELCLPQITGQSFQIAYDGGKYAWVAVGIGFFGGYPGGAGLFRIDLSTVLDSPSTSVTDFGQPFPFSSPNYMIGNLAGGPFGVVVENGTVYSSAEYNGGNAIAITNPATNRSTVYYFKTGSGGYFMPLSTDGVHIYTTGNQSIEEFDPTSSNFSRYTTISVSPCFPVTVDPHGQWLWTTCGGPGHGLAVVNNNGSRLHVFDYPNTGSFSYVDSANNVWFTVNGDGYGCVSGNGTLCANPPGHSLVECQNPCSGNATFVTYPTGYGADGPYGTVYDASRNGMWIADYWNFNILFFNMTSRSFVPSMAIQVDKKPYMGFVDSTGVVWNLALGSADLVRIPPASTPATSLTTSTVTYTTPVERPSTSSSLTNHDQTSLTSPSALTNLGCAPTCASAHSGGADYILPVSVAVAMSAAAAAGWALARKRKNDPG